MVGGKDHTTHHLVYAGFKDKQVWIIFSVIGFISFVLSVLIVYLALNNQLHYIAFFLLYFLLVFGLLYRNTIKNILIKNKIEFFKLNIIQFFTFQLFIIPFVTFKVNER